MSFRTGHEPTAHLLQQAIFSHRQGNLAKAREQYGQVLALQPGNFDALQGAGILYGQAGRFQEALGFLAQACQVQPRSFISHYHYGLALQELRRYEEALSCYDEALALKADFAPAHLNRGNVLKDMQRIDEALVCYKKAVFFAPNYTEVQLSLGNVLQGMRHYRDALASFNRAIALKPDFAEAHNSRANVLKDLYRYDEALSNFSQALLLNPKYVKALNNRGNVLRCLQRFGMALADCNNAIALQPDFAEAHNSRGAVLDDLQRYDEALVSFNEALALQPDFAEAYNNRAVVLREMRCCEEALSSYDRAIALKPEYADAYNGKGLLLLLTGNFQDGWPLYEWRWRTNQLRDAARQWRQPRWQGERPITDKVILLHAEQGFGDTIQFIRYAAKVEALGAKVIVEAPVSLLPLLQSLQGNFSLVAQGGALPDFDLHCPLMSLPLAFGTTVETIPADRAYLSADPRLSAGWAERLEGYEGLKVGLVWAGGLRPGQAGILDRRRSLPLSSFALLADIADVNFFSLQIGPPSAQLAELRQARWDGPEIVDFTDHIHDWADTAALVDNLDLVISCDTSTAHLAAALGKPTWILNRYDTCWRWLLEREDSPWYPTVRLFRQTRHGDWIPVLDRVRAELLRLTGARPT